MVRTALAAGIASLALMVMLSVIPPDTAFAAGPPATQCNNDAASNVGGQGVRCTVTIVNYVDGSGNLASSPASTVVMTRCTGAAGPVGAGAGTCATTTLTTVGAPVTSVQQCDNVGNGGGGVVICTVAITNRFSGGPVVTSQPATIYQCVGSAITGPGAPAICGPNRPGVTSVGAATVGQCNGSGNGGTSVGFICDVTAGSTTTTVLPVSVDQCNGSANGGGALTTCRATVTNEITAATVVATASPTASPAVVVITPVATAVPTVAPAQATATVAVPAATVTVAPGVTTGAPGLVQAPGVQVTTTPTTTSTITPPKTGNAGQAYGSNSAGWAMLALTLFGVGAVHVLARRK